VDLEHQFERLLAWFFEHSLQHLNDEFHRRFIVV